MTQDFDRRKPAQGAPDAAQIVSQGAYYRLPRCASHDEDYPKVVEAFYEGVGALCGPQVLALVKRDGLGQLHRHFPTEKVLMLESYVETKLRHLLYKWSYKVGVNDLKLNGTFYVDHLIVIRIHLPFEVARTARTAETPRRARSDVLDHAVAAVRNPRILLNQASRALRRPRAKSAYAPKSFHGDLVKPARSHGAHIDTWYGHSFDGINLWWSIEGVNALNSVILYPDMAGRPVNYDPRSMYLAPGASISEPVVMDLAPGELLMFNPEVLHSTHVNISDETRIALTTRLNPGQPRFNDEAPFNFEHWHLSTDLAQDRFDAMAVYPASKNKGKSAITERKAYVDSATLRLSLNESLAVGPVAVASDKTLGVGVKLCVDLADAKVFIWRTPDNRLVAWSRLCPHVGVDLADGWHNDTGVHCPGHGVKFDFEDGSSACQSFRLTAFKAFEKDDKIWLERSAHTAQDPATGKAFSSAVIS